MNRFYETLTALVVITLVASGAVAVLGPAGKTVLIGVMLAQLPLYGFLGWSLLAKLARG